MPDGLTIAEECIDRQARTEVFEGHQIANVTGRVMLHALDGGRALCGHDLAGLTSTGQPWSASYLPHLPRCPGCSPPEQRAVQALAQATGVDVRTAHGGDAEEQGAAALRAVLSQHVLLPWMFTDVVTVDDSVRGGFSHPLTISPALLVRRPALALTTFLHEQLHWMEGPGTDSATAEARQRWPDPPPPPAGGHSAASTWLHMSVCALEYQSLCQLIGLQAATAELEQHSGYSWLYGKILADPGWFAGYLRRHGLAVPEQPPVPRRYFGDPWWDLVPGKKA